MNNWTLNTLNVELPDEQLCTFICWNEKGGVISFFTGRFIDVKIHRPYDLRKVYTHYTLHEKPTI